MNAGTGANRAGSAVKGRGRHGRRRHFFTIVESMVASIILTMVFSGVYAVVHQSLLMIKVTMDHYLATTLAHNRIEKMRAMPVQNLALFTEEDIILDGQGNPDDNGIFRRTVTVSDAPTPDVVQVTVAVEIRNRETGAFEGKREVVNGLLTNFPVKAL
jgi:hypothetical protein